MLSGDFLKLLHRLNPKLRVCSKDNSNFAAGLYYINPYEGYVEVCGVDKNFVPERTEVDEVGHILRSGWRRVINILLAKGLTTREKVKKALPSFFEQHVPGATFKNVDPLQAKIAKYVTDNEDRRGEKGLDADEILDLASDVRKKDTDAKREVDAQNKWELNRALDKNQKAYI